MKERAIARERERGRRKAEKGQSGISRMEGIVVITNAEGEQGLSIRIVTFIRARVAGRETERDIVLITLQTKILKAI